MIKKYNLKLIEKFNNLKCPRCSSRMLFDYVVIKNNYGAFSSSMMTRCCGSDFYELVEDFGLMGDEK